MKKQWILMACLISSNSFADQFLCATNMQYVYTGDTVNSVIATCGQPDSVQTEVPASAQQKGAGGNLVWYYQTAFSLGTMPGAPSMLRSPTGTVGGNPAAAVAAAAAASSPVNLAVIFTNGQVSSIQQRSSLVEGSAPNAGADGQEIGAYKCQNGSIQVGAGMNDVANACGLPIFQRAMGQAPARSTAADNSPAATTASSTDSDSPVTLLTYKPQDYLPAQVLMFKDGLLVGQK